MFCQRPLPIVVLALPPILLCLSSNAKANNKGDTSLTFLNNHTVSLHYEVPTAGELNIDEDPLLGLQYRSFINTQWPIKPFASIGFKTDSDKTGISSDIYYLDIGGQYDFANYTSSRNYVELSFGATYSQEEIAIDLLDRVATDNTDQFGLKTTFAVGYETQSGYGIALHLNEYSSGISGRTIGLSFSYSF